jgi:hypothetical protein
MSATWLLALGESFKTVREGPRPYTMARGFFPRFAGRKAGGHGACEPAAGRPERPAGPAQALSQPDGGAAKGAATGQRLEGLGLEAARAKWNR